MWRIIGDSVKGSSHTTLGTACQDRHLIQQFCFAENSCAVVAISDGAGSAEKSEIGAELAVKSAIEFVVANIETMDKDEDLFMRKLYEFAILSIKNESLNNGFSLRDYACTLLVAIFFKTKAYFGQIGDGAWVAEIDGKFECSTWPENGEFANETVFITSDKALDAIQFVIEERKITFFSGFTDGIQNLALDYSTNSAHAPFFTLLKAGINSGLDNLLELGPKFRAFLESDSINERTDDDKTLVLGLWHLKED